MDILKSNLHYLGFNDEEIQIYMCAIETQASTILEFAHHTGIPRTTVYLLVDSLLEKGLITEEIVGKKKKYIPLSPTALIQLAKEKEELYKKTVKSLQSNVTQLQALYNLNLYKPKIQFYQGKTQVITLLEESLTAEKIYLHFMSREINKLMEDYLDGYFDSIDKKMISTYEMVANSTITKQNHDTLRNQVISIPEKYITQIDFMIFNTKVVYLQLNNNEISALTIDDPNISFFEKTKYIMFWKLISGQEL